ncbi:hypothetical protein HDG35_005689 [Paraburkholderia sp. JPY681]|nr:hypothetical protein [Paraburkholderia atlantica]
MNEATGAMACVWLSRGAPAGSGLPLLVSQCIRAARRYLRIPNPLIQTHAGYVGAFKYVQRKFAPDLQT